MTFEFLINWMLIVASGDISASRLGLKIKTKIKSQTNKQIQFKFGFTFISRISECNNKSNELS